MSIANHSFENAAAAPAPDGRPADWVVTEVSTDIEFAAFSVFAAPPDEGYPRETCEIGWPDENQTLISEIDDDNSEFASFDIGPAQQLVEDFENNWGVPQGVFELVAIEFAEFDSLEHEAFESGWGTIIYAFTTELEFAVFDSLDVERFEVGWRGNEAAYAKTGIPMSIDYAEFRSAATTNDFEDFQETVFDRSFSVDVASEKIELTSHGFVDEDIVYFYASDGESTLPDPIEEDTPYFVTNDATDDFEIEEQIGDGSINLTTAGTGTFKVKANYKLFWTEELEI